MNMDEYWTNVYVYLRKVQDIKQFLLFRANVSIQVERGLLTGTEPSLGLGIESRIDIRLLVMFQQLIFEYNRI